MASESKKAKGINSYTLKLGEKKAVGDRCKYVLFYNKQERAYEKKDAKKQYEEALDETIEMHIQD